MNRLITALLALTLMIPATALAAPGGPGKPGASHFQQMDSNGDGVITAEEHAAAAAKRFATMDSNGDGKLTREEMRQHWQQMHRKRQSECPWKEDCPNWKNCPRNKDS